MNLLLDYAACERFAWLASLEVDGGCEATDGCWVEPDGVCEHGYPSWLRYWSMI